MKILLIDDHKLFLDGVRYVLESMRDIVKVEVANTVNRGLQQIDNGIPFNLILVDIELPGMDGFAFLEGLRERQVSIPTIVLSSADTPQNIVRAIQSGSLGFIPKAYSANQMINAINHTLAGNIYIPEGKTDEVDSLMRRPKNTQVSADISHRKLQVLRLLNEGYTNKEIANVLEISEAAVKFHIGDLFKILNVKNRMACVNEAQKRQLI